MSSMSPNIGRVVQLRHIQTTPCYCYDRYIQNVACFIKCEASQSVSPVQIHTSIAISKHYKISPFLRRQFPLTGHYIYVLICGYDAGADMFEIRDPLSTNSSNKLKVSILGRER